MEITKQTEQYKFIDSIGEWSVMGTVYNNVVGSMSISGAINSEVEQIGNFNYSKPVEGNITFNIETQENNREIITSGINCILNKILDQFK